MYRKVFQWLYRRIAPVDFARRVGVKLGVGCRLINVDFGSEPWLVTLGDHVSVTKSSFVTHDGGVWILRGEFPHLDVLAPIVVGSNVFIGSGCIVLPGVEIGDNVVVGAGSVVTRNIPSNSISAGVPARVLGSVDDYRARSLKRGEMTKHMSALEKKRFYTSKFNLRG